jgi:predicted DNA-binding transcriptional regulator AlpA
MLNLLSKKEVARRIGFHPEHIMRMAREGAFPQPVKLSTAANSAVRFVESEVEGWLASRLAARKLQSS